MPGFRSDTGWKKIVALVGYLFIASLLIGGNLAGKLLGFIALAGWLLATNAVGLRARAPGSNSPNRLAAVSSWFALLLAGVIALSLAAAESNTRSDRPPDQASEARPESPNSGAGTGAELEALPTGETASERQSQAEAHLTAAADYREERELGLALVELGQALTLAPSLAAAQQMQGEVSAEATASVRTAQAQAAAAAREASVQATALSASRDSPTVSGGVLGAARSEWSRVRGSSSRTQIGYERFSNGIEVLWQAGRDGQERAWIIEVLLPREQPIVQARQAAQSLHPADGRMVRTYRARAGQTVEVFQSPALGTVFDAGRFGDEPPGTYIQIAQRGEATTSGSIVMDVRFFQFRRGEACLARPTLGARGSGMPDPYSTQRPCT